MFINHSTNAKLNKLCLPDAASNFGGLSGKRDVIESPQGLWRVCVAWERTSGILVGRVRMCSGCVRDGRATIELHHNARPSPREKARVDSRATTYGVASQKKVKCFSRSSCTSHTHFIPAGKEAMSPVRMVTGSPPSGVTVTEPLMR